MQFQPPRSSNPQNAFWVLWELFPSINYTVLSEGGGWEEFSPPQMYSQKWKDSSSRINIKGALIVWTVEWLQSPADHQQKGDQRLCPPTPLPHVYHKTWVGWNAAQFILTLSNIKLYVNKNWTEVLLPHPCTFSFLQLYFCNILDANIVLWLHYIDLKLSFNLF